MPGKTKRRIWEFIGFMGVIAIISAAVSGYFFRQHVNHVLQKYAFMTKSQALMLKEHGAQLKDLAAGISSYEESPNGPQPASSQDKVLEKYAGEVQENAEKLQHYGDRLLGAIQDKEPGDALAAVADEQLSIPENLGIIKTQAKRIDGLQAASLRLQTSIRRLRRQLYNCRKPPPMSGMFPPEDYPDNPRGANRHRR
ncbi:MAG: hypothetical protein P8X90_28245 [Desulfobacterales bacterium]